MCAKQFHMAKGVQPYFQVHKFTKHNYGTTRSESQFKEELFANKMDSASN